MTLTNVQWTSKMKYIIDIIEIEKLPEDHFKRESWPNEGLFLVKSEGYVYHVYRYGVNFISDGEVFTRTKYEEMKSVPEELFLKSLAAINGKLL